MRVQLADGREDVTYCSLDAQPRRVGDVTFAGAWAVLSRQDDSAAWAWTYDGRVSAGDLTVASGETVELPLVEVRRVQDGAAANAFVVEGAIPDAGTLPGTWLRVLLGDQFAYGHRIEGVRGDGDRTVIRVGGEPGFALTDAGDWEMLFNPFYDGPGPCRVQIKRGAFSGAD